MSAVFADSKDLIKSLVQFIGMLLFFLAPAMSLFKGEIIAAQFCIWLL